MKTLSTYFECDSAYWGENSEWLVAAYTNRDADCLTRSNWRVLLKQLGGESGSVRIERANHWACGWIDYLIISPDAEEKIAIANEAREAMADCPVLSDDDFSELEMEEANQIWESCYSVSDRMEYIRKHRSQFEFRGLGDALDCARGKYFAGYASELIS